MIFTDTQVQACFDLKFIDQKGSVPNELQEVGALMATHDWFRMVEGSHSARVHETIERLLSPEMRPGLHRWYRHPATKLGTAAIELREQLSRLAGERFEQAADLPLNPS